MNLPCRPHLGVVLLRSSLHPEVPAAVGTSVRTTRLLRLVYAIAAVTAVFAVGGALARLGVPGTGFFDLDGERNGAASFSALLLVAAGAATITAWCRRRAHVSVLPVGVLLLFMAVDEFLAVHEAVERSTGVDWQVLYLPVFGLAGAAAVRALIHHRPNRPFTRIWLLAAACWGVSQILEKLQWDGAVQRRGYSLMMIPEELLEMAGSAAFLVGAILLLQQRRSQHPA